MELSSFTRIPDILTNAFNFSPFLLNRLKDAAMASQRPILLS